MPLVVKDEDVKWNETLDKLYIIVPLPDRYLKHVSISTATRYLKVSSPPYIWECVLPYDIDPEDKSIARVEYGAVCFELLKSEKRNWGRIKHERSNDKIFLRQCREEALKEIEKRINDAIEAQSSSEYEKVREAVRKQMELDDSERTRVEDAKRCEKQNVSDEITKWEKKIAVVEKESRKVWKSSTDDEESKTQPRNSGTINVAFTPRVFPSAARESKENEERQWLEKQAMARKNLDLDTSDLSREEKNPVWLEAKGDSLFQKGDFFAAANAYSLAILMNPLNFTSYGSKASCYLELGNLNEAIEDSTKALKLLHPPVSSNSKYRLRNHIVRGKAYFGLKLYVKCLMDLEAALRIDSGNADIRNMSEKARQIIQSS